MPADGFWRAADGFTFQKLDPQPDMVSNLRNCFDGGNTMFWSEAEQQYVLYYRFRFQSDSAETPNNPDAGDSQ